MRHDRKEIQIEHLDRHVPILSIGLAPVGVPIGGSTFVVASTACAEESDHSLVSKRE